MNKEPIADVNGFVVHELPQPTTARYILIVASRGMTSEVNSFSSFKEAKRAFGEIARNHGYKPKEINASDYYDVSIWEWTEDRYEKIYGY